MGWKSPRAIRERAIRMLWTSAHIAAYAFWMAPRIARLAALIPLFQCLDRHCERQHEGERRIEETRRAVAFVPLRGMIAFGVDQQSVLT
jgi:hypothetical protein